MKKLSKHPSKKESDFLNLYIYNYIRQHQKVSGLTEKLNISKSALSQRLKQMKLNGLIEKVGYGVWKTTEKKFSKHSIGTKTYMGGVKQFYLTSDTARNHAYQWTLKIPKIKNWENREQFLKKKKINYKIINKNVFRITYKKNKVWLCDKSIVIYTKKGTSYFAETPEKAHILATNDFIEYIKSLERLFNISFKINKKYYFKPSKKHISLIKNAIAKEYAEKKEKLYVEDETGVWLICDDSFNLNEMEFQRNTTNLKESKIVQNFFNSLKEYPITTHDIKTLIEIQTREANKWNFYADNIRTHTESIIELKNQIKTLGGVLNTMKEKKPKISEFELLNLKADLSFEDIKLYEDKLSKEQKLNLILKINKNQWGL